MSSIKNTTVAPGIAEVFSRFFDGAPASADIIDTTRGDGDFRVTFIVTTEAGERYVLKFASNDFTFPERIRAWQRTAEEYRALGYYCPQIFCDKSGGFPTVEYKGNTCVVYAEEFSKYKPLTDRAEEDGEEPSLDTGEYFEDIWSMTAKIAAKRFDYTEYPSAYCLFTTFCPSDERDEVLDNALEWKRTADALPEEFSGRVQRIWRLWNENREKLSEVYSGLPTSVFQADLNATNLLIDDSGAFMGVYDFNLCGRDVFLNYLMRENSSDTIPRALTIACRHYAFSEEEKAAAPLLFRCLKPLWYTRVEDLKEAGDDPEKIRACLDKAEEMLAGGLDLASYMG